MVSYRPTAAAGAPFQHVSPSVLLPLLMLHVSGGAATRAQPVLMESANAGVGDKSKGSVEPGAVPLGRDASRACSVTIRPRPLSNDSGPVEVMNSYSVFNSWRNSNEVISIVIPVVLGVIILITVGVCCFRKCQLAKQTRERERIHQQELEMQRQQEQQQQPQPQPPYIPAPGVSTDYGGGAPGVVPYYPPGYYASVPNPAAQGYGTPPPGLGAPLGETPAVPQYPPAAYNGVFSPAQGFATNGSPQPPEAAPPLPYGMPLNPPPAAPQSYAVAGIPTQFGSNPIGTPPPSGPSAYPAPPSIYGHGSYLNVGGAAGTGEVGGKGQGGKKLDP